MSDDWTYVGDGLPGKGVSVLGWDQFYNAIHICLQIGWSGRLLPVSGNDDVSIVLWRALPRPSAAQMAAAKARDAEEDR